MNVRLVLPILAALALPAVCAWAQDPDPNAAEGPQLGGEPQADAQPPADAPPQQGVQVLARGPVHEAFAEPVTADAAAGVVIERKPPDPIEELPPDVKPEGNAEWIPGYWGWDDDRKDFIWVSGAWRVVPGSQRWVPGYWAEVAGGFQYVGGFWNKAEEQEIAYLPPPPKSLEAGPSTPSPDEDHFWVPGSWRYENRYAWSTGYWARVKPNWVWMPARLVWTPSGYVFVRGYWDYPIVRRGWLFAPVYFSEPVYARAGFLYTPTVVLNTSVFSVQLFTRPRWNAYYFGDYYDARYATAGFVPWYEYGRTSYDPIFTYQRWSHRSDPNWFNTVRADFALRRRDVNARPARVYAQTNARIGNATLAVNLQQFVSQEGMRDRVVRLQQPERRQASEMARELRNLHDERRDMELRGARTAGGSRDAARTRTTFHLPQMSGMGGDVPTRDRGRSDRTRSADALRADDNDARMRRRTAGDGSADGARDAGRNLFDERRRTAGDGGGDADISSRRRPVDQSQGRPGRDALAEDADEGTVVRRRTDRDRSSGTLDNNARDPNRRTTARQLEDPDDSGTNVGRRRATAGQVEERRQAEIRRQSQLQGARGQGDVRQGNVGQGERRMRTGDGQAERRTRTGDGQNLGRQNSGGDRTNRENIQPRTRIDRTPGNVIPNQQNQGAPDQRDPARRRTSGDQGQRSQRSQAENRLQDGRQGDDSSLGRSGTRTRRGANDALSDSDPQRRSGSRDRGGSRSARDTSTDRTGRSRRESLRPGGTGQPNTGGGTVGTRTLGDADRLRLGSSSRLGLDPGTGSLNRQPLQQGSISGALQPSQAPVGVGGRSGLEPGSGSSLGPGGPTGGTGSAGGGATGGGAAGGGAAGGGAAGGGGGGTGGGGS